MTELVRRTTGVIDPAEVARLSKSKLLPEHLANDPASAEYMMRIGQSLGLDPVAAFQHIFVFPDGKGRLKAGMSAHLMAALAVAAGHTLHIEGNAIQATAVLVRNSTPEELDRFRTMREEERRQKLGLLEDTDRLYKMQRQQILDRIEDLRALVELGEKPADEELKVLRQQLSGLHKQYDFDALRQQVSETKFDLTKLARFESVWTMKRANGIGGLTNKSVWQDFGPEMLKSRAKSGVVRDGAIDVILGVKHIMGDLGITFADESVDDYLAPSMATYTAEELGADVNEEGVPLQGRIVDVTIPGVSKEQDRMIKAGRILLQNKGPEGVHDWALRELKSDLSVDDKISRFDAVLKATRQAEKEDAMVGQGDASCTLSAFLNNTIDSLRQTPNRENKEEDN